MRFFKVSDEIRAIDVGQEFLIAEDWLEITLDELATIRAHKKAVEFEALSYSVKRSRAYPPIVEYLDAIVKDDSEALQEYKDKCLAIKAKYPKNV